MLFVCTGMWNEGGAGHEEQNNVGSSDRLAFILWETPLLNNKPLRLFLKTGCCQRTSIFLQAVPPLSGASVIFIVQSKAPEPSSVHVWARCACVGERSALRCGQKEKPFAQKCKGL